MAWTDANRWIRIVIVDVCSSRTRCPQMRTSVTLPWLGRYVRKFEVMTTAGALSRRSGSCGRLGSGCWLRHRRWDALCWIVFVTRFKISDKVTFESLNAVDLIGISEIGGILQTNETAVVVLLQIGDRRKLMPFENRPATTRPESRERRPDHHSPSIDVGSITAFAVPMMPDIHRYVTDVCSAECHFRDSFTPLNRQLSILVVQTRSDRFLDSIEQSKGEVQITRPDDTEVQQTPDSGQGRAAHRPPVARMRVPFVESLRIDRFVVSNGVTE